MSQASNVPPTLSEGQYDVKTYRGADVVMC